VTASDVDWEILPRQANLSRLHDPLSNWKQLTLIERDNTPDTWSVHGPPSVLGIFEPGMGCILNRNGEQVTSGQVAGIHRSAELVNDRVVEKMTISFAEDLTRLERIIFPTPSHNLTTAVSNFPAEYDLRTGAIETVIIDYIKNHAGSLAQLDRRIDRLRVPATLGRGGTTQVSGRLDHLGVLVRSLAEAGNLRVTIKHTEDGGGAWLDVVIDSVSDLSANIRFGTADSLAAGIITSWSYDREAPSTTRAIVAGGGEGAARDFLQLDDTVIETTWGGAVVETLIDQRQVDPASANKTAELTRAAQEALDEGAERIKVEFQPVLGPDLEYRRDVRVGDIVGYDLPGLAPAKEKIREATTVVSAEPGQATERVSVVVGSLDAMLSRAGLQQVKALRAIDVIQRSQ
jgi:hypothetical protein